MNKGLIATTALLLLSGATTFTAENTNQFFEDAPASPLFFGKKITEQAANTVQFFKRQVAPKVPVEILAEILSHYLNDKQVPVSRRTIVALEFLADPNYSVLIKRLLGEVIPFMQDVHKIFQEHGYLGKGSFTRKLSCEYIKEKAYKNIVSDQTILDLLDELLALGLFRNPNDYPAIFESFKSLIMALQSRGISLNKENFAGITPLIWTTLLPKFTYNNFWNTDWTINDYTKSLREALIKAGADVNYKNKHGRCFKDYQLQLNAKKDSLH